MRLAARGTRVMNGSEEPVGDPAAVAALAMEARTLHVQALIWGAAGGAAGFLFPICGLIDAP